MTTTTRRALVTGASGDIGAAICAALADAGCFVYAQAHANPARAQATVDAIRANGGAGEVVVFDVTDAAAARAAIDGLLAAGSIGILVHNAGIHDDAP
ncbi:MAG: SDR family NAD(P)-dependent oxidoreductase, partial [Rudaea sp.]|nr:SDR family NAD(P)-dependent oxidoreductase [Rudaea sp.]